MELSKLHPDNLQNTWPWAVSLLLSVHIVDFCVVLVYDSFCVYHIKSITHQGQVSIIPLYQIDSFIGQKEANVLGVICKAVE